MTNPTRILYVDDEDQLRILVKDQLVGEGFAVELADDGDTAMEILEKQAFDLVLLDIKMQRVSGIDVLRYMKERKLPARVIMLTAVDDLSVALEAVKKGANDYLTKPYDLGNLLASMRKVLAR